MSSERLDRPDARLEGTMDYALNLVAGPIETLYLYRLTAPGCP